MVGAILSRHIRLSLNVVIWSSLETLVMVLLIVNSVIVLETAVSLGTEIEIVSVLDTVALDGGAVDWHAVGFSVEAEVWIVLLTEAIARAESALGRVAVFTSLLGATTFADCVACTELVELQDDSLDCWKIYRERLKKIAESLISTFSPQIILIKKNPLSFTSRRFRNDQIIIRYPNHPRNHFSFNLRKYFIDQAFLLHSLLNYFNNWRLYFRATYLRTHIHVLPYLPLKIHVLSPKSREHKFKSILSWDMQAKIWNHFQRIQYPREVFF